MHSSTQSINLKIWQKQKRKQTKKLNFLASSVDGRDYRHLLGMGFLSTLTDAVERTLVGMAEEKLSTAVDQERRTRKGIERSCFVEKDLLKC